MEFKNNFEKKCKCGETFTPYRTFDKLCYVCTKTKQALKNLEAIKKTTKKKQREDLMTLQDYFKIAQTHFNKYIRLRDAGNLCISCKKKPKKENAGHYFSAGTHTNVRFDEMNVHLQCEHCNTFLSGNLIEYGIHLENKIGADEFTMLRERAYITRKYTKDELKELAEYYKQKCKELSHK
jgi:hypothetical protein